MNPRTALMFAAAILLIVANVVEKDSSVSQIAEMNQGELRERAGTVADMSGFTPEDEIGPQEAAADRLDESDGRPNRTKETVEIADFSWEESTPNAPSIGEDLEEEDDRETLGDTDKSGRKPGDTDLNFDPRKG